MAKIVTLNQFESLAKAVSGSSGSADLTVLTKRVAQLEEKHVEVIGIEQLSSDLRVGKWQTVDNESNNLNGDASEVASGDYIGIEQTATGEQFGSWQQIESSSSEAADSETVLELQTAVANLTTALEKAVLRITQLEEKHAEVIGIKQLKSGLRVGKWQSVDTEENNLNGDAEDYDEVIVENIETVGIEQLTTGEQFGSWQQVA